MLEKIVDPNRGSRLALTGLGAFPFFGGIIYCIFARDSYVLLERIAFLSILFLSFVIVTSMARLYFPYVVLDRDGVTVRFFRKKFFPWRCIQQAGRYHRNRKDYSANCYSLVLVLPGGSGKQAGVDKTFLERNSGHAVVLPNDRTIRLFIIARYRKLNYDDYNLITETKQKMFGLDKT